MFIVVDSPCLGARILTPDTGPTFNVVDYGAVGNGHNDESQVCFSISISQIILGVEKEVRAAG